MVQGGYCGVRAVGAPLCSGCWAAPWAVTPAPGMRVCFSLYAHAARRPPPADGRRPFPASTPFHAALATEMPQPSLLDQRPYGRSEPLVNTKMTKHMLVQASYQVSARPS